MAARSSATWETRGCTSSVTIASGRSPAITRRSANDAGGKDNVTVVYVEGERFAPARNHRAERSARGSRERASASEGTGGGVPATIGRMSKARQALGVAGSPTRQPRWGAVGSQRNVKKVVQVALVALLTA